MANAILVTGPPSSGKTTTIVEVLSYLDRARCVGFYTNEIRKNGYRVGFQIVTISGASAKFATKVSRSHAVEDNPPYRLHRESLEGVALDAVKSGMGRSMLIVIDELGPLQFSSALFRQTVQEILNMEQPLLGTIVERSDPFGDWVKAQAGVKLLAKERGASMIPTLLSEIRHKFLLPRLMIDGS